MHILHRAQKVFDFYLSLLLLFSILTAFFLDDIILLNVYHQYF